MANTWEQQFRSWAEPPSQSEIDRCTNAVRMVSAAITESTALKQRSIRVFAQGSYNNRTNVRQDSDVDIAVICSDTFFEEYPAGTTRETFSNVAASYTYAQFKLEVGAALADYFPAGAVTRGNKAFDIKANSNRVEADVAPFFEHRRYAVNGHFISGVELKPDNGIPRAVINWPEQHYANAVAKNTATSKRYKGLVRVLKNLRNDMVEAKIVAATPITGFLCECLLWNVPNTAFGHDALTADLRAALQHLYTPTTTDAGCHDWGEVSELKYLFRSQQKWTRQQANEFVAAVWTYVGYN